MLWLASERVLEMGGRSEEVRGTEARKQLDAAGKDRRFSALAAVLQGLQVIIEPMLFHQGIMGSLFHDPAMVHDQNAVGPPDGGQAMGNHDARAVRQSSLNGLFDKHFRFRVDIGGSLVQHQDAGVSGKHPGKSEELFLTRREVHGALADFGFEPLGKPPDHCRKLRELDDLFEFFLGQAAGPAEYFLVPCRAR